MKWRSSAGRPSGTGEPSFAPRLVLLAFCFLGGVLLGQVLARRVPAQTGSELEQYLQSYLTLHREGRQVSPGAVLSALWLYFRYPAAAALLGLVSGGVVLLPCLTAAFGFFLSFSVCCFTAAFGGNGVLLALSVFGIRCAVTLPCYFLLAVPALGTAAALTGPPFGRSRRRWPVRPGRQCVCRLGIFAVSALAGAFAELLLSPLLLQLVLLRIFS